MTTANKEVAESIRSNQKKITVIPELYLYIALICALLHAAECGMKNNRPCCDSPRISQDDDFKEHFLPRSHCSAAGRESKTVKLLRSKPNQVREVTVKLANIQLNKSSLGY